MHRLPKIFSHNSNRRKIGKNNSSSSTDGVQAYKPKPRFERCNASNNINYEFSPDNSSLASYTSVESVRPGYGDLFVHEKSFRVDGLDGNDEIDIICKTLGISGIEDLAISPEDYRAMKVRTAYAPDVFSPIFEVNNERFAEYAGDSANCVNALNQNDAGDHICFEFPICCRDIIGDEYDDIPIGANSSSVNIFSGVLECDEDTIRSNRKSSDDTNPTSNGFRGNGIKGVRPPNLVTPFFMETNDCISRFGKDLSLEEDGESGENSNEAQSMTRRIMNMEENCILSESCSFTTSSNDDDSSSTTTELNSSVSPNGRFRRSISGWDKGQLLGAGTFGSVYEGISEDGFFFAVKEVSLLDQGDDARQRIIQLEQEIALLSQFEHDNIVRYYGTMQDESHLYIFLELVTKGSLLSLYQKYVLRDSQVSAYTRQILHGLNYLHNRNVVHRDIKCANILVDTNGSVKLADFGLAKATKLNDVKSCKGTALWMAPEVVRSQGYGLSADIWSLGCTVLEMLTGRFPYSEMEWMAALYWIGKGRRPSIPDSLSSDARDFILQCLQVNPSSRPSAAQLLDHPFVRRPLPTPSGSASPHYFGQHI